MDCILADKLMHPHHKPVRRLILQCIMLCAAFAILCLRPVQAESFNAMFGYSEVKQQNISVFPQWQHVIEEQSARTSATDDCAAGKPSASCLVKSWTLL